MIDLQNVHQMMEQEVTRKEFLQCVGVAILSLIGVTHVLHSLQSGLNRTSTARRPVAHGYGASVYGR
jgi:hypothetical protein